MGQRKKRLERRRKEKRLAREWKIKERGGRRRGCVCLFPVNVPIAA